MKLEKHHYAFLFVSFLFLGIISPNLFSDGMFMDGLLYADISRNMAEGLGSFWKPYLSSTENEFYAHPPLAFGLQSIGFKIFGDSIYVERFYSLLTFIIVGYLIVLIWGKITNDKKSGWQPLFLWTIISNVIWSVSNNMLENTMTIFIMFSFYSYLKSMEKNRFVWLVFSGISLFLGLLTKGFVCLYIWSTPFFIWLFKREKDFWGMVTDTAVITAFTILPILFLYFTFPAAQNNMNNYLQLQVVGSIKNVQTVTNRFYIIWMFFNNILTPLLAALIVLFIAKKKKIEKKLFKINLKESLMFLSIVLSGIIPIMISMKQRNFYISTVYPLFSIGLAYYLFPLMQQITADVKITSKFFNIFKKITVLIIIVALGLSVAQINRIGRDKETITECKAIIKVIGENSTANICPKFKPIRSIHGYFSRYGNVSLDTNQNSLCKYYISQDNCNLEFLQKNYKLVPLNTKTYKLYERIDGWSK